MSKTRDKRLRRLAGPSGVVTVGGKTKVAPLPKTGTGHWQTSGAGTHQNKRRKNADRQKKQETYRHARGRYE